MWGSKRSPAASVRSRVSVQQRIATKYGRVLRHRGGCRSHPMAIGKGNVESALRLRRRREDGLRLRGSGKGAG
jgi:hypothetical protein